jgi:hypothetical protein
VVPPSHSWAGVPPALHALVLRLLAKNPGDRFASAGEVRDALEGVTIQSQDDPGRGNLPLSSTAFDGREKEFTEVRDLLESYRLVAILGAGDALALGVGVHLADQFADGVWWVDIESAGDASRLLETVASNLRVPQDPHRFLTASLIEHLQERELLLILAHSQSFPGRAHSLSRPF